MSNPDWFILMQQWRLRSMGVYGVTLPFLVGALAHKSGESSLGVQHIHDVLNDIIKHPVDGFVTEVRWCGDIDAPVFTAKETNSLSNQMPFKSYFPRPNNNEASLGFSTDLQSMFGLDCKEPNECYEKLIKYSSSYVEKGQFSRNWSDANNKHEYGGFSSKDLEYIKETIIES